MKCRRRPDCDSVGVCRRDLLISLDLALIDALINSSFRRRRREQNGVSPCWGGGPWETNALLVTRFIILYRMRAGWSLTPQHTSPISVFYPSSGPGRDFVGARVRQVPGLLCDAVWAAHHLPLPSAPIWVREELLSGSRTAWVIGCTLKWSLLNFKQAVLAANAVAALCGSAQSGLCGFVCVCVCVRVCSSSTEPGATVSRPQLTASQSRAGGEGASMETSPAPPPSLPLCAREYEWVWIRGAVWNDRLSAVVIMMILMIISSYQWKPCSYSCGGLIERGTKWIVFIKEALQEHRDTHNFTSYQWSGQYF